MACPNCGSTEAPLIVQRFINRRETTAFYNCVAKGCDFSSWDREDFAYEPDPVPLLEDCDVTWDISGEAPIRLVYEPPIRLLSNPRPVNWERE